jgi:hypothetical protein
MDEPGSLLQGDQSHEVTLDFETAALPNQQKKVVADGERAVFVGRYEFQAHVIVTEVRFRNSQTGWEACHQHHSPRIASTPPPKEDSTPKAQRAPRTEVGWQSGLNSRPRPFADVEAADQVEQQLTDGLRKRQLAEFQHGEIKAGRHVGDSQDA